MYVSIYMLFGVIVSLILLSYGRRLGIKLGCDIQKLADLEAINEIAKELLELNPHPPIKDVTLVDRCFNAVYKTNPKGIEV